MDAPLWIGASAGIIFVRRGAPSPPLINYCPLILGRSLNINLKINVIDISIHFWHTILCHHSIHCSMTPLSTFLNENLECKRELSIANPHAVAVVRSHSVQ